MNADQQMNIDNIDRLAGGIQSICAALQKDLTAEDAGEVTAPDSFVRGGLIAAIDAAVKAIQNKILGDDTESAGSLELVRGIHTAMNSIQGKEAASAQ